MPQTELAPPLTEESLEKSAKKALFSEGGAR